MFLGNTLTLSYLEQRSNSPYCFMPSASKFISKLQATTPLLEALHTCAQSKNAPFYTPGHKRGQGIEPALAACLGSTVFRSDLPELPELDNLFAPQGVIQSAQELAAAAFGAEQTWFLTNGSTCGIIAAVLATCGPGDRIILPRNVHRSVIAGLILSGAEPIFIAPEYDPLVDLVHSITPAAVEAALQQHPEAKAVLMVYPTYHGICGDVEAIAGIAHQREIPLLVDEAHGPHFAFHPGLPISALAAGADISVQSTHKVLAAMTQAAMLHVQGNYVNPHRITQTLGLVQSTSPSYLLLASLDAARHQMATQGKELMSRTLQLSEQARAGIDQMPGLSALSLDQCQVSPGFIALDPTRLTIKVSGLGLSGFAADEILHQQLGVTAEFPSLHHLTFIISLGNQARDIECLLQACTRLAEYACSPAKTPWPTLPEPPPVKISPRTAFFAPRETVTLEQAVHRISSESVCPYPPGIPVLLPGEAIAPGALAYLHQIRQLGSQITGCSDPSLQTLQVIRD